MILSEIAKRCPNLPLYFKPKHGWGWTAPGNRQSSIYDIVERYGAFELEAEGVFTWNGVPRGLYGIVSAPDHLLSGCNFVLWSMGEGVVDPEDAEQNHRWDLFFSHQPFCDDHTNFPDRDEAGVGYGTPSLERWSDA